MSTTATRRRIIPTQRPAPVAAAPTPYRGPAPEAGELAEVACGCVGRVLSHTPPRHPYPSVGLTITEGCGGRHGERLMPGTIGHFSAELVRPVVVNGQLTLDLGRTTSA